MQKYLQKKKIQKMCVALIATVNRSLTIRSHSLYSIPWNLQIQWYCFVSFTLPLIALRTWINEFSFFFSSAYFIWNDWRRYASNEYITILFFLSVVACGVGIFYAKLEVNRQIKQTKWRKKKNYVRSNIKRSLIATMKQRQ